MRYYRMERLLARKIPLFAMIVCIALAVVVTETMAAYEFANHECSGEKDDCSVCLRVKAAADFLDTLRLACLLAFFSIFLLLIPQILEVLEELIPDLYSLVTLKVRSNT